MIDVRPTPSTHLEDSYHALILGYASGTLDQAQTLITALHIALSKRAQRLLREYECLGASFLEKDCTPIALCDSALDNVLARIDSSEASTCHKAEQHRTICGNMSVDDLIAYAMNECKRVQCTQSGWRNLHPGFHSLDLDLACKSSTAKFLRVDPAKKTPMHSHGGIEITLILEGSYSDSNGHYERGDMIVTDENCEHAPKSCPDKGCLCMVVSSTPIRLSGIAKLLNPFIKL